MRISYLWTYIYGWKELICLAAVVVLIIAVIAPVLIRRFDYRKGREMILYYLYQRSKREILYLSVVIFDILFVLACILFQREIDVDTLLYLLIASILLMITGKKWKLIIIEVLHMIVINAALLCGNVMFRYLQDVKMDPLVLILYILLNVFIITYMIFFGVWHLAELKHTEVKSIDEEVLEEE